MPKTLYVPQRRAAYLNSISEPYTGIDTLYTDNFSVCNMLVCINQDKIILFHISVQIDFYFDLGTIIKLMGPNSTFILISRLNETFLTDHIKSVWADAFASTPYQYHAVDDTIDGVSVSFKANAQNKLHPNVVLHTEQLKHETLIHHPSELQFNAIEKVEQIISMRHLLEAQKPLQKNLFIFNSFHFVKLPDQELDFSKAPPAILKEFSKFKKDMSFTTVAESVEKMIDEISEAAIKTYFPIRTHSANNVAYFITSYLHQFDPDAIFHHELTCLLRENHYPFQAQDEQFVKYLQAALDSKETCFKQAEALLNQTKASSPCIDFFKKYISVLIKHYQTRQIDQQIKSLRDTALQRSNQLAGEGKRNHLNKSYSAASRLYIEALHTLIQNAVVTAPQIEVAYYNAGRATFQAGNYHDAAAYLALGIKVMNKSDNVNKPLLLKAVNALEECKEKIESSDSSTLNKSNGK